MRASHSLLWSLALAAASAAQLAPGELLAAVRDPIPLLPTETAALFQASLDTGTATRLTLSPALRTEGIGALVMTTPGNGFLATTPSGVRGTVRAFTLLGGTVTDTVLNTQPMPGRQVRQMAVAGADLWFVCTDANASHGSLGRLPLAGGAPTVVVDFTLVPTYRGSLVAGLVVLGSTAIVATANGGTSPNYASQLFQVQLQPPYPVTWLADLPLSRAAGGSFRILVTGLALDPAAPNVLVVGGRDGDLLRCDVGTGALLDHRWFVPPSSTALGAIDSLVVDPVSGDLWIGVPDGRVNLAVLTHGGVEVLNRLQASTSGFGGWDRVTALWLMPQPGGSYRAFLPGCPGATGREPTSRGLSAPVAGNPSWAFELGVSGGNLALLFIGRSNQSYAGVPLPLALAGLGLPGCQLGTSIELVFLGDAAGRVSLPLPPGLRGLPLHTQWLTINASYLIEALSDARTLVPG